MRIRDVEPADLEAVAALVVATLAEFGFASQVSGVERDLRAALQRYRRPTGGFWVADDDGIVAGTVAIRPKEDRTCELKRLYVRADMRGRRLGQQLYEHAEHFVRRAEYDRIWLDSSRRFVAAHRLYLRNGFVLVESLDNDWQDDVFEKLLA
jgi:putative acetyltransferase